jgi:hypothetical protein
VNTVNFLEMKRKAEITFEVEETIVLRADEKILNAFCPLCRASVEMLAPRAVAYLSVFNEREIFRLIEAGAIYFVETDRVYVCPRCLKNFIKE